MKKENKVISLGLAQKISEIAKKKGIKLPESEWIWYKHPLRKWVLRFGNIITNENLGDDYFPAYDTAELVNMLPYRFNQKTEVSQRFYWLKIVKTDNQFIVSYNQFIGDNPESIGIVKAENSLVETMGEMYLYLLENDLLK